MEIILSIVSQQIGVLNITQEVRDLSALPTSLSIGCQASTLKLQRRSIEGAARSLCHLSFATPLSAFVAELLRRSRLGEARRLDYGDMFTRRSASTPRHMVSGAKPAGRQAPGSHARFIGICRTNKSAKVVSVRKGKFCSFLQGWENLQQYFFKIHILCGQDKHS